MTWKNAGRDPLPRKSQEVLISIGGVYYVAYYDQRTSEFQFIKDGERETLPGAHPSVYWTEIIEDEE